MEIQIRGLTELVNRLDKIQVQAILEKPMTRSVIKVETALKKYPEPPINSTYRRTRVLGNAWTHKVERISGGVQGIVGNRIKYAPFVQSGRFQARIHRGRWQTAEQVIDQLLQGIISDFSESISKALHGRI